MYQLISYCLPLGILLNKENLVIIQCFWIVAKKKSFIFANALSIPTHIQYYIVGIISENKKKCLPLKGEKHSLSRFY